MDYPGLILTVVIIAYGVLTYQRRRRLHKEALSYIRRGVDPPERTQMFVRDLKKYRESRRSGQEVKP